MSAEGNKSQGDRSLVGTARARPGEDVPPLLEIVLRVQGAAAFSSSPIDRNGLRRLPTLVRPSVEKHDNDGAVLESPLKAPV